ncbi:HlyD family secretion protein [Gilvimarinus agarilyticus]|uniref:Multidrug resistance efflux pump n=1 Tax=Reichenbachiella agariperforans TaxID=156994 RepID=A0A1M6PYI7_REIAG|nr:biotin/lipoyl-binding protein [Reichenbachiella agariperforans]MBU2884851.1 HlyD family secretion protein [Gilvimarinus agarilyticus]MBU2913021.1 HlyD family secretion protein [Reichenbachiella agariperforans]SHK12957.1 Multidrug resistance efflux pump [Reichenbachiella agariperforans]
MLNISHNSIDRDEILKNQSSYQEVMRTKASRTLVRLLSVLFFLGFVMLFLPWTQSIRARGTLTTLRPENREQEIHSVISGRVEKWFVREGQFVAKGDTIIFISEMKSEYLDPDLIEKSKNQTNAKEASITSYKSKAEALRNQIDALENNQKLKLKQAKNYLSQQRLKVNSDSIEYETAIINLDIAQKQFARQEKLYEQGLKSLTELEQRRQKLQEAVNKKTSYQNKWFTSQNELINAQLNINTIQGEFQEKIAKAQSDLMSAVSMSLEAESDYNKLSIQQSNYTQRSGFYYIKAPQDGYVTRAITTGIGETVKEGDPIFSFIPSDYDLALQMYIRPIDLPLVEEGRKVQIQFDGWPALVFSGWPNLSFGTYTGRVVAYDKAATANGEFRVLVSPDPDSPEWPQLLRIGSGAYGISLLKNVPIWYEMWRNLNGFPPDFYINEQLKEPKAKKGKVK